MNLQEQRKLLKSVISADLYKHSIGAANVSYVLAEYYGINKREAYLAGLWHDYAKDSNFDNLRQVAIDMSLGLDSVTMMAGPVLHAFVGAARLEKEMVFLNSRVLQAIRLHTTGGPGMSKLEKIIYLADAIEPNRNYVGVEKIRKLAFNDFNAALLEVLNNTLNKVLERGNVIHPLTVAFWNELLIKLKATTQL